MSQFQLLELRGGGFKGLQGVAEKIELKITERNFFLKEASISAWRSPAPQSEAGERGSTTDGWPADGRLGPSSVAGHGARISLVTVRLLAPHPIPGFRSAQRRFKGRCLLGEEGAIIPTEPERLTRR